MKKILGLFIAFCVPVLASAQMYYRGGSHVMTEPTFWGIFLPIIWFLFMLSVFVFWLVMLIDAIKNSSDTMKIVWVVVIIFTWVLGALIYYFMAYRPRVCKSCGRLMEKKPAEVENK